MSVDAWKVLINSGTLEADASLTKVEFLAWFDCGNPPNCEQLKLIIEGFKVGNWTPETELPSNLAFVDMVVNGISKNGNTYNKSQINQLINNISTTSFGGELKKNEVPLGNNKWWFATEVGVYPNAGNVQTVDGGINVILKTENGFETFNIPFATINEVIDNNKNLATSGNAVYDFVKKEIATINLFNKKTFKPGFAFSLTDGSVVQMNSVNGISELIPVDGNSLYGLSQEGDNNSSVIALYLVEYNENKNLISWQNVQSRATIKTSVNTRFIRLNPNSIIENFDFWKDNFIFSKVENFPIKFVNYGETEKQIFQNDLSFFEKHNFFEVSTLESQGVTFENETLKITTGEKNFSNQSMFLFATALKFSEDAVS